jgi:LysM repeat protein
MALLEPEDPLSGAGEAGLPPQPDGDRPATTQEETLTRDGDLVPEIGAPADSDPRPPEIVAALEVDEPLDPALEELFREANAEAEEDALVPELPDIPIRELLNELVSLGRSLGIEPSAHVESANGAEASAEPERPPIPEDRPTTSESGWPPPGFSRRHALHTMLLSLTLVMAIASLLVGADHIVSGGQNQSPQPRAVATITPGVAVRQVQPGGSTPEATPTPAATRQPAYFLYTVQRGDTLTAIAASFGLSLDHILWTNPDVIDDPDLLLVGDKLLIPNVAGMIYYVEPGDILSVIGRLLPNRAPDDSGTPSRRPGPP